MAQAQGVDALLTDAYRTLTSLDLPGAQDRLERALDLDFEDAELLYALKCARWWSDSAERVGACLDHLEAGDLVMNRWKAFRSFLARLPEPSPRAALAFKHYAFKLAHSRYSQLVQSGEAVDPELSLRLGRACKGYGDYDAALAHLEAAAKARKDDAAVLAELADLYALLDDARASKALFREAFFLNPQRIDLELLDNEALARLAQRAAESAGSPHEIPEWVPVYGELMGVFSIKRELKAVEAAKLRQSVYEMETELSADATRRPVLLPRLLNRYFWMIDHYVNRGEEKARIDEILLKIRLLDANVYALYTA